MDRKEFLKQMIVFGQELLEQEQEAKLNVKAISFLQEFYGNVEGAINNASDLEIIFGKDKRNVKINKAIGLLMKVQELMNPLAEDEDIQLV